MSNFRKIWDEFKTELWQSFHKTEPNWKQMAVERQKTMAVFAWGLFLAVCVVSPYHIFSLIFVNIFLLIAIKSTIRIWMDSKNCTEEYPNK